MKVSELMEKLADADGEMEIFVAPLVELKLMNPKRGAPDKSLVPSPYERYKLTEVSVAGEAGDGGGFDLCLLLGYDESRRFSLGTKESLDEPEEFIN